MQKKGLDRVPKPVPKTKYSERFNDLKPVVDSGMTVTKYVEMLKEQMPKGEIFRRIRAKKLAELLGLYAYSIHKAEAPSESEETVPIEVLHHHTHSSIQFQDQPDGYIAPSAPVPNTDCPFLLLDVRDEQMFENCTIKGAINFPKARLARATNVFTPEILSYKNKPNKMIIVFDDFGFVSGEVAQTLSERDFDNIFLLHDGLAQFGYEFPNLVGPNAPPKPPNMPKPKKSGIVTTTLHTRKASPPQAKKKVMAQAARERKPFK